MRAERRALADQAERDSVTLSQWAEIWFEHLRDQGGDVSVALRYQHATAERDRALTKRLAAALR